MATLEEQRVAIRRLLDESSVADAHTTYYALHHDPKRTSLFLHYNSQHQIDGFLVRAQTGLDLFRPVVVVRAENDSAALDLFKTGLLTNRPYYLVAPMPLRDLINHTLTVSDSETLCVYQLDLAHFEPPINILVTPHPAPDGLPRYEISANGSVQAAAGINWQSPHFAELYVYTEPTARRRGWGKAVVAALSSDLLKSGRTPLYVVNEQNTASINLATSAGFVDTGVREYTGQIALRP